MPYYIENYYLLFGLERAKNLGWHCCLTILRTTNFWLYLREKKIQSRSKRNIWGGSSTIPHQHPPAKLICSIPTRVFCPCGRWWKIPSTIRLRSRWKDSKKCLLDFSIIMVGDDWYLSRYASAIDIRKQARPTRLLHISGRWRWILIQIRITHAKTAVFFKQTQHKFGSGRLLDTRW